MTLEHRNLILEHQNLIFKQQDLNSGQLIVVLSYIDN